MQTTTLHVLVALSLCFTCLVGGSPWGTRSRSGSRGSSRLIRSTWSRPNPRPQQDPWPDHFPHPGTNPFTFIRHTPHPMVTTTQPPTTMELTTWEPTTWVPTTWEPTTVEHIIQRGPEPAANVNNNRNTNQNINTNENTNVNVNKNKLINRVVVRTGHRRRTSVGEVDEEYCEKKLCFYSDPMQSMDRAFVNLRECQPNQPYCVVMFNAVDGSFTTGCSTEGQRFQSAYFIKGTCRVPTRSLGKWSFGDQELIGK